MLEIKWKHKKVPGPEERLRGGGGDTAARDTFRHRDTHPREDAQRQGLTLVHFTPQRNRFLWAKRIHLLT